MHWIFYLDLDAFYVSCELVGRPELADRPVIVGPDPALGPTRGVVLSASYAARTFGVRSAIPVAQAARLCPDAVWIPADFGKYERTAEAVRALLREEGHSIAVFSIDEAAFPLDAEDAAMAERAGRSLQQLIQRRLGLPASFGISPFLSVAKIACDQAKPRGVTVVLEEETASFLAPLSVGAIPGVGGKTAGFLRSYGVERIGDMAHGLPPSVRIRLGSFATELVLLAKGTPHDRELPQYGGPRSRSTDRTFPQDIDRIDELRDAARSAARDLAGSLAREQLRYQTVTVAVRWNDFTRSQRSRTLPMSSFGLDPMEGVAVRLLEELWNSEAAGRARAARALSVRVERLKDVGGRQPPLEEYALELTAPSPRRIN